MPEQEGVLFGYEGYGSAVHKGERLGEERNQALSLLQEKSSDESERT